MIRDVLITQKRELEIRFKEKYIERKIDEKKFSNNLIKVIIGPRRAGKSFFGIHLLKNYEKFGYINFDDERLINISDYDEIINSIDSVYNNPSIILFDEIQNLDKWELFINRLARMGRNIILTGSNSKLLSKELASHLTGRHIQISIFPFLFSEYIKFSDFELTRSEIKNKLNDYVEKGGYPEPIVKGFDSKDYLSTLFDSILYKDIVKRYNIRYPSELGDIANYLLANITKEFSYRNLSNVSRCKSILTIQKYIDYLEETFLFFKVTRFSFKLKEQISSNKKVYCIDNGLVNSKAFRFSSNIGKLYENLVAICLKKLELDGVINFYFWKNQQNHEVDFLVMKSSKINSLIQVCYNLGSIETLEREKRALLKASKELNCDKLYILNEDVEKEETFEWFNEKAKIIYLPLYKWLLSPEEYIFG